MAEPFSVRIRARVYELDFNGHVAATVLMQYAIHARAECLRAAGVSVGAVLDAGLGHVSLEETIRYRHELRADEEVDVTCSYVWGERSTFRIEQELRRVDGTLVAEVSCVAGLMDLSARKLVGDPAERWRAQATDPGLLNL